MWTEREGVLLRLEDESGSIRYGEASPISWFGTETVEDIEAVCRELGAEVTDDRLDAASEKLACLRTGLTEARRVWEKPDDLDARVVAALLPAGAAALEWIEPRSESGFRVFKWKVGVGDLSDELALLDDVCARLPSGGKLRLDANGAWDSRAAERWLDRCADYPVEYVEQPCFVPLSGTSQGAALLRRDGSAAHRKTEDLLLGLAGDYPTPLALDESLVSAGDVTRWIDLGWPGYYVIKTSLLGGWESVSVALEKAEARVVFSSALETGVGAKAALRHAFEWKGSKHALGFGLWPLFADQRMDGPFAAPFIRWDDVQRINEEAIWNALK